MTEDLITIPEYIKINTDRLELIKNKGLKNRVKNECNVLYKIYHNVVIKVDTNKDTDINDKLTIEAVEFINANVRTYKFIITSQFPFHPPKMFVNNRSYAEIMRIKGDYEKTMIKKIKKQDCFCCRSVCCFSNWSPAIKLFNVINEIKDILKFKRDIVNLLLADKIKNKYNIPYAYIETYLM